MLRARTRGRLLQGEADYQLHVIYLWYERQTPRALQLLQSLHERYPANPLFLAQIAEIQDVYQHDVTTSLASWQSLLAAARDQRVNAPVLSEVQARLGMAKQLEVLHQTDDAIEMLQAVIALHPAAPYASLALAYLRLGEAYDRMGVRVAAVDAYRAAIAAAPSPDLAQRPEPEQRAPPQGTRRQTCRGVSASRSKDGVGSSTTILPAAATALERLAGIERVRSGCPLSIRPRATGAQETTPTRSPQFEHAIRGARTCPAPILGNAYLEAARVLERLGRRADAISYYQHRDDAVRRRRRHTRGGDARARSTRAARECVERCVIVLAIRTTRTSSRARQPSIDRTTVAIASRRQIWCAFF